MSKVEKNKGGQKSWATNEQKEWLTSKLPSFMASRSSTSPSDFWAGIFEGWFEKWPIGAEDGEVETSSEERLKRKKAVSNNKENNGIDADLRVDSPC